MQTFHQLGKLLRSDIARNNPTHMNLQMEVTFARTIITILSKATT